MFASISRSQRAPPTSSPSSAPALARRATPNPVTCLKVGQASTFSQTLSALGAGTYYVIVQSYPGTQGATTVRLSTGHGSEICDNGVDDDGNGLVDCADQACVNAPNCLDDECKPELNLGALVVGDAPKSADFDTSTTSNRYHPTCAGSSTGDDYAVRFTLHETAGVLVQWTQSNGSDHVITIFHMPPPGLACDASQMSCYYPGGAPSGTVAFAPRGPATTSSSSRRSGRAPKGRCTSASRPS